MEAQSCRQLSRLNDFSMAEKELSQKERMLAGRFYYAVRDPQLLADRNACRLLCAEFNATQGSPPAKFYVRWKAT